MHSEHILFLTFKKRTMLKQKVLSIGTVFIGLSALLLSSTGCSKDDNNNNQQKTSYTLSGNASGAQEVPTVTTQGTGTLTGSYNSSTNTLSYTITWTGLSGPPTMMHFHGPAAAGENASVVLPISGFPATAAGTISGSGTLSDAQEADLLAGKWYYNIHTSAHGGGEIRGQVAVQ
jgi:hypothetical protein